jgi:histone-lysine N-methyltransferase SETMAR
VTGIAKNTVHEIISDLNFRKVSARWVPKMITKEHKSRRRAALLEHLCRYQDEGESFLESIIKGDEMWVYESTPEAERNSMTWKHPHSPTTEKFKIEPSVRKTLVTLFWDCEGLLLCEFLPPKTISSDRYCETLKKLCKAIKRKRPG